MIGGVAWTAGVGWPAGVLACPVCFSMTEGAAADGTLAAVIVLMGVTVTVLSGAAVFVGRFVRRSAERPTQAPP